MSIAPLAGPNDGFPRCPWSTSAEELIPYHDDEWGFPVADSQRLFEKVCLESFQAGLSWRTVLNKRTDFRRVFHSFDMHSVAAMTPQDVARLLKDPSIIRNRSKIEACINNAQRAIALTEDQGSLASYFWSFEPSLSPDRSPHHSPQSITTSPESIALAKDLKKRGWKFVGPTTAFAFMQAMGLINDHVYGCITREAVVKARAAFTTPATC